jgi:hypothetical protein
VEEVVARLHRRVARRKIDAETAVAGLAGCRRREPLARQAGRGRGLRGALAGLRDNRRGAGEQKRGHQAKTMISHKKFPLPKRPTIGPNR